MKSYTDLKQEWKKHRQEIYHHYLKTQNVRLTAEHYHLTYPRVQQIIKKEAYATTE